MHFSSSVNGGGKLITAASLNSSPQSPFLVHEPIKAIQVCHSVSSTQRQAIRIRISFGGVWGGGGGMVSGLVVHSPLECLVVRIVALSIALFRSANEWHQQQQEVPQAMPGQCQARPKNPAKLIFTAIAAAAACGTHTHYTHIYTHTHGM